MTIHDIIDPCIYLTSVSASGLHARVRVASPRTSLTRLCSGAICCVALGSETVVAIIHLAK